jgi:predicted RNA-binding Zn-ribbon protein involved in translation (DUF1610 family)
VQVLATFGDEFNISTIQAPEEGGKIFHPARQVCTACGAVLGVRDAVCPSCGGDVRTGRTQMRITKEEKRKRGLLRRKSAPKARPKAPVRRPARRVSTGMSTGVKVLIGLGVLIVVAGVAVVALLMLT